MKRNLKKHLKRNWNWSFGSGSEKGLYIDKLKQIIIEQDKRISKLEESILIIKENNNGKIRI